MVRENVTEVLKKQPKLQELDKTKSDVGFSRTILLVILGSAAALGLDLRALGSSVAFQRESATCLISQCKNWDTVQPKR